MHRPTVLVVVVAALALILGAVVGSNWVVGTQGPGNDAQSRALTNFELIDLQGRTTSLAAMKGQVIVANFWATWCAPCRDEIPGFIASQSRFAANGVTIVGIALDSAEKVAPYARQIGINYPLLLGGAGGIDLLHVLGNRQGALPYTAIVDRAGRIVDRHLGLMTPALLEEKLRGYLPRS